MKYRARLVVPAEYYAYVDIEAGSDAEAMHEAERLRAGATHDPDVVWEIADFPDRVAPEIDWIEHEDGLILKEPGEGWP